MSKPTIYPAPVLLKIIVDRLDKGTDKSPGQGPQGECWQWTRCVNSLGYGQMRAPCSDGSTKTYLTHRVAYYVAAGIWPVGLVLHSCDNPPCRNPAHLSEGTHTDNAQDMLRKGRGGHGVVGCGSGSDNPASKLTENQVEEIRMKYAKGGISHRALASHYRMSQSSIGFILRRALWKHV